MHYAERHLIVLFVPVVLRITPYTAIFSKEHAINEDLVGFNALCVSQVTKLNCKELQDEAETHMFVLRKY